MSEPSGEVTDLRRAGRCYELSARFLTEAAPETQDQGCFLIHGQIKSERPDRDRLEHAWVVKERLLDGGKDEVWDPTLDQWFTAEFYYAWTKATEHARWSRRDAIREMLRRNHYGPWAGPDEVGVVNPDWCADCGHAAEDHGERDDGCDACDCAGFEPEQED